MCFFGCGRTKSCRCDVYGGKTRCSLQSGELAYTSHRINTHPRSYCSGVAGLFAIGITAPPGTHSSSSSTSTTMGAASSAEPAPCPSPPPPAPPDPLMPSLDSIVLTEVNRIDDMDLLSGDIDMAGGLNSLFEGNISVLHGTAFCSSPSRKGLADILEENEESGVGSTEGSLHLEYPLSLDADTGDDGAMMVFGEGGGILADLVGLGSAGKDDDVFPLGLDLSLGFSDRMNVGITSDKSCSTIDSDYGEWLRNKMMTLVKFSRYKFKLMCAYKHRLLHSDGSKNFVLLIFTKVFMCKK